MKITHPFLSPRWRFSDSTPTLLHFAELSTTTLSITAIWYLCPLLRNQHTKIKRNMSTSARLQRFRSAAASDRWPICSGFLLESSTDFDTKEKAPFSLLGKLIIVFEVWGGIDYQV